MTKRDIARKFKMNESLLNLICKGTRYTPHRDVAMFVAAKTGNPPIQFIHPDKRDVFLRAYPEMKYKFKFDTMVVRK